MFGAIAGALKGIGSGIASGVKGLGSKIGEAWEGGEGGEKGGGFDWNKLMGATQAFGQGMGPNSDIGQGIASIGQGGQAYVQGRAADRAEKKADILQKAQAAAPVATQSAEQAGIGGLTPPPMEELPMGAPMQIPGVEMMPEGYVRKAGRPLMY